MYGNHMLSDFKIVANYTLNWLYMQCAKDNKTTSCERHIILFKYQSSDEEEISDRC